MPFPSDFERVIERSFKEHGIEDNNLQKALAEIIHDVARSSEFVEMITERQQQNERTKRMFRGDF